MNGFSSIFFKKNQDSGEQAKPCCDLCPASTGVSQTATTTVTSTRSGTHTPTSTPTGTVTSTASVSIVVWDGNKKRWMNYFELFLHSHTVIVVFTNIWVRCCWTIAMPVPSIVLTKVYCPLPGGTASKARTRSATLTGTATKSITTTRTCSMRCSVSTGRENSKYQQSKSGVSWFLAGSSQLEGF